MLSTCYSNWNQRKVAEKTTKRGRAVLVVEFKEVSQHFTQNATVVYSTFVNVQRSGYPPHSRCPRCLRERRQRPVLVVDHALLHEPHPDTCAVASNPVRQRIEHGAALLDDRMQLREAVLARNPAAPPVPMKNRRIWGVAELTDTAAMTVLGRTSEAGTRTVWADKSPPNARGPLTEYSSMLLSTFWNHKRVSSPAPVA
ncbi:hypothetical protein MIND_01173400 [Mycena indigotica]|uniref:Uncharacterized protein n=1 Tax=Mycena indigotica TaxID=2126181 RepID=A0A8H6VYF3_9AGAR|nr:uncharacterized protein MIND_01173400 [Mycena indigotica]KAF7292749.1 hypothetical protein MIND_01173400 [Mycena indigotica]